MWPMALLRLRGVACLVAVRVRRRRIRHRVWPVFLVLRLLMWQLWMRRRRVLQRVTRHQLRLGPRAVRRAVLHVLLELLLLDWLVWLGYWEWLLLCNFAIGKVIVHNEDFHDGNTKSKERSFVDTFDGRTCEHERFSAQLRQPTSSYQYQYQYQYSLAYSILFDCVNSRQCPFPSRTKSRRCCGSPVQFLDLLPIPSTFLLFSDFLVGRPSSDPSRPSAARLPHPDALLQRWTDACLRKFSACRILQLRSGK